MLIEAANLVGQTVNLSEANLETYHLAQKNYFEGEGHGSPLDALEDAHSKSLEFVKEHYVGASFYITFFAIWGDVLLYVNQSHRHIGVRRINEFIDFDEDPIGSLQLKDHDLLLVCSEGFWQKILSPSLREHQDETPEEFSRMLEDTFAKQHNNPEDLPLHAHATYISIDPTPGEEEIIQIELPQKDKKFKRARHFSRPAIKLPSFPKIFKKKPEITVKNDGANKPRKWMFLTSLFILLTISIAITIYVNNTNSQKEEVAKTIESIDNNLQKATQIAALNPQESLNLVNDASDLLGQVEGIRSDTYQMKKDEIDQKAAEIFRLAYNVSKSSSTPTTLPENLSLHFLTNPESEIAGINGNTIINPSEQWGTITSAESYLDNIYLLDPETSNIWKYQGPVSPNDAPSIYQKETLSLATAQDIAIDGSVYLLFPDSVKKLTVGKTDPFSLRGTFPPLVSSSRITTGVDSSTLIISSGNLLLIFDKSGTYQQSLEVSNLSNISDIISNDDGTILYLYSDGAWHQILLN